MNCMKRELERTAQEAIKLARMLSSDADGHLFAFAESCTAGMVCSYICAVPGASDFFPGGIVAYSDLTKIELLDVDPAILKEHGAVSGECALAMARGARAALRSTIGVSVTGIAGPGGGSAKKPVGTVWFAVSSDRAERVLHGYYPGRDRAGVRGRAALTALELLLSELADRAL